MVVWNDCWYCSEILSCHSLEVIQVFTWVVYSVTIFPRKADHGKRHLWNHVRGARSTSQRGNVLSPQWCLVGRMYTYCAGKSVHCLVLGCQKSLRSSAISWLVTIHIVINSFHHTTNHLCHSSVIRLVTSPLQENYRWEYKYFLIFCNKAYLWVNFPLCGSKLYSNPMGSNEPSFEQFH